MKDYPRLRVANFTVEKFDSWKHSLKERNYSPESINHYLFLPAFCLSRPTTMIIPRTTIIMTRTTA